MTDRAGERKGEKRAKTKKAWNAPNLGLLVKLGSAIVHADEFLSPDGHPFDLEEFKSLLNDAEVQAWLEEGAGMAFLPIKRIRRAK
jgi:hypothetical protein